MSGVENGVEQMLDRLDELAKPEITVTEKAAGLARRFIAAYGEPDYELSRSSNCLYFEWKHYAVEIYPDGRIMFQGSVHWETLLGDTGHMGRLARIGSAVKEAMKSERRTQTCTEPTPADQTQRDGVREVAFPVLAAFHPDMQRADKQQIVKILEETAELSVAANDYRKGEGSREHMADELADVLQTLANFVDAYQLSDDEITAAVHRVTEHNRERGRYQPGERHMF